MPRPCVDVVIAAHDPRRKIGRAVASVLASRSVAKVIVVCHNTPIEDVARSLGHWADDRRVVLESLVDGIPSPAGPFNHGLERADAVFTTVVGSDDEITPRAIDEWVAVADRESADVVIPTLRYAGGRVVPTPPRRPWRRTELDGVKDRLAYRTAPLGLVSRERFTGLRMTDGLATGEDFLYSTRLWFSGASVALARGEYVIHDDAERVTFTRRPVADDLAAVGMVIRDAWVCALPLPSRTSIAVKLWRVPVFGAVHNRSGTVWTKEDRRDLALMAAALGDFSHDAPGVLSRADHALIDVLSDPRSSDELLTERSRQRRLFLSARAMVPARSSRIFAREAPLRFSAASWLAGRSA